MTIRVAIHHRTSYQYDRLVSLSPQIIRLRPAPHCRTPVHRYALDITPSKHFLNWQQDPFGNFQAHVNFPDTVGEFRVEVDLIADLTVVNPFDFFVEAYADNLPFKYEPILAHELQPYLETEPVGPRLRSFLNSIDRNSRNTVSFLVDLNARLQSEIRYIIRLEPGVQTCEETLEKACGSCRDTGWLLVQILRHLGLAARFVSGYLVQLVPDVKPLDGPAGAARDFTDLHAWTEVYLPGAGWIGLDPTSGLFAGEGHIPLACTPHYTSAAPISGTADPCETTFDFSMSVSRYYETPRVTKPYTEEQWQTVLTTGRHVDARLRAGDVRLTMGGEPTFVSIDDMDGAEWTVAAVGPMKRRLAGNLLRRLQHRFAPGGLLHYGQGKWYPDESLPRWAMSCLWRTDGQPLWHDLSLLAAEEDQEDHSAEEAKRFIGELASRMGVEQQWAMPAYEDVWHYLAKERKLPVNVPPGDHRIEDAEERARLAKVFEERGLGAVAGFVLPLQRQQWQSRAGWTSGPWTFRAPALFLLPGDSPIGFRLPLEALPWEAQSQRASVIQADPFGPRQALPPQAQKRYSKPGEAKPTTATQVVRTAVCIEPRRGRLYVFMPPVDQLEDYLDLLAGIEETAAALRMPVILEGYLPPADYRLNVIKVTPDPGVIEVNIHPASSWDESVEITTALYEEARLARLGTEKFGLDGRHTGTGGGNHVVLGGPTPADSPFLRRPDLLRSLLGCWNNHPSLSYLFSGLFIGPTSQAPRVDEGRRDALYELEIAFEQVPEPGGQIMPWLADRLFRHLLTDLTGNTHRAELCIDKLYSPDSTSGRLGLVEFRAFEMPPHARMSLTQQLLLRALVARFWDTPFREPLIRWGTTLHDRFLLPFFIWRDFVEVIREVNQAGFALELEWFAPHFEFRCPQIGQVSYDGITLELRSAIEPWYVLGEEPGAVGTARDVDSSLERLQVRVSNLTEGRHVITCNGRKVPLHPTGIAGEYVAGVRYRAWQPAHCLHPTIDVHTPLVFDIVDVWQRRSLGGCTYHVAHPGGRNYTTFPVNAYEAESRRAARFFTTGHTGGVLPQLTDDRNDDYPLTLDLRRS